MSRKRSAPRPALAEAMADPVVSARMAGLRYVIDEGPGIGRRRAGKGFSYPGPDGRPMRDRETLRRIKALAIPPAWTEVWICPSPSGHLQATGRDARGASGALPSVADFEIGFDELTLEEAAALKMLARRQEKEGQPVAA